MTKTKQVVVKKGKFVIETVIDNGIRTIEVQGEPKVSLHENFIQFGCMRFSRESLKLLSSLAELSTTGYIYQEGTYHTKDPNS